MPSTPRVAVEQAYRPSGRFAYLAGAAAALILLSVLPFCLAPEMQVFYLSEGGPIQVLSAAGYLVVATTLIREMSAADLSKSWYLVLIPIAMCLREMDFHAHFTTYNITNTLLYVSPEVPFVEKIFGVSVFAVLGIAGYFLAVNHTSSFVRNLRRRDFTSMAIAAAMISAVASKTLDGAASNLSFLGIDISSTFFSMVIEEVLELGIPIFLATAAFSYVGRQKPRAMPH
ncbi:hypothetical protein [Mesorhizobium sp. CAU 1732]|uniref:hypothetical protein n=1 Tax=Mesorhizobium sp. CAU 1732 TaxID=3140358 RepID=UPI003260F671